MNQEGYIPVGMEEPDLDTAECQGFKVNFQRAILLSLLESRKLTQAQYEACMEKVTQKYAVRSHS